MQIPRTFAASLLLAAAAAPLAAVEPAALPHGLYLEARTAAVFGGACHANGQLTTTGREALVGWSFEGGHWQGVPLAGLAAAAMLSADRNLDLEGAKVRSVLYLDPAAPPAAKRALRALLVERYASLLGEIVELREAQLRVTLQGDAYRLEVEEAGLLEGVALPDRACCSMPSDVWYRPFATRDLRTVLQGVLVGNSRTLRYDDLRAARDPKAPRFLRTGQNDAFVASFRILAEPAEAPASVGSAAVVTTTTGRQA